ncbi:MAG: hypothetical protein ACK5SX_11965 [Sandaracinobacter sp.]|jgi:hypothetical protein
MFLKDPQALLDYRVDWGAALGPDAQIAASNWGVRPDEPGGLIVSSSGLAGAVASVRLGGGIAGHVYVVGNRVTLSDGVIDERSLTVRVEDR